MSGIISYDEMLTKELNTTFWQGLKIGTAFGCLITIFICINIL